MKKRLFYTLLTTLLCASVGYAQDLKNKVYYDKNWKVVKKESEATYCRYYNAKEQGVERKKFYDMLMTGQRYADGEYIYIDNTGKSTTILDGKYTSYYPDSNGTIREQGTYNNNLKDGEWTYYDENGHKTHKITYRNDKKNGKYMEYHYDDKGTLVSTSSGTMRNNMPEGPWEGRYLIGGAWQTIDHKNYHEGKLDGKNMFISGDTLFDCNYIAGVLSGSYKASRIMSLETIDKPQLLASGTYYFGKKIKHWTMATNEFGAPSYEEGDLANQIQDGVWRVTTIRNKDTLHTTVTYKNGKIEGDFIQYDRDGNITTQGKYANGKRIGIWTYKYFDEGITEIVNHDDKNAPIKFLTSDGKPYTGKHKETRTISKNTVPLNGRQIEPDILDFTIENSTIKAAVFSNSLSGKFINVNKDMLFFHSMMYSYLFGE